MRRAIVFVAVMGSVLATTAVAPAADTGRIVGTLLDRRGIPASGQCAAAYPDAEVGVVTYAYSNAAGAYALTLPPGGYRIRFAGCWTRYVPEWYDDVQTMEEATVLKVTAGADTGANAVLEPGGTIAGRLTGPAGDPAHGECVFVYHANGTFVRSGVTDAAGNYEVTRLETGVHYVRFATCSSARFRSEWYADAPNRAQATPVAVTWGADVTGIDAVLDPGAVIQGTVTDPNGAPIANSCVVLHDADGLPVKTDHTDATGLYELRPLNAGTYKIRFGCEAKWQPEWYDEASDFPSATAVTVAEGWPVTIDEILAFRPPPANDDVAAAIVVDDVPFVDVRDTNMATVAADEPKACVDAPSVSAWYRLAVPRGGLVQLSTVGSDYNTVISAFVATGGPGVLVPIACRNDRSDAVGERLTLAVTPMTSIYVQISGGNGVTRGGSLRFSVS